MCVKEGLGCSFKLNGPGGFIGVIIFGEGFEGGEEISYVNI